MKKIKRVFLIVLDSLGIGYAPDAEVFGDFGANTLRRICSSDKFKISNLISMGLGNIDTVSYLENEGNPNAAYGRMQELSAGKDTTVGHWELCGLITDKPFPTYPAGFPDSVISSFSKSVKRGVICNRPYSGTEVIKDFGDEHIKSGKLIVYTSADSVFQIAAHEDIVPIDELYGYCKTARALLSGEYGVARVIARPFIGSGGCFKRTENRRDFSIKPPRPTVLDAIKVSGFDVLSVGKINDIFVGEGITESFPSHSNEEGMRLTSHLAERDFCGLCFTNLVDFDMLYGHRQDIDGYARALSDFDSWLGKFLTLLKDDDALIITADHGCDPGDTSTDHTRECVPLIIYGKKIKPVNLGTLSGFCSVGMTVADMLGIEYKGDGSFKLPKIY